ncbi:DNA primase [Zymobacter palmae]|uniref:DNA primase n=2 Tax=Zymobacter palmae TaxID=33074 RepID=A0A348HF83_9GAMM|nr:DNA primase [Zymobacter palmae]
MGSIVGCALLAGCASTSPHVISHSIEVSPGINVVRTAQGNVVDSITMRRDATRVNDLALRDCLLSNVVPANREPATDIVQPEASVWQRPGEVDVNGQTVHYRLSLQRLKDQNYYLFDQLGQPHRDAQGQEMWTPVPAWDHQQPKALHSALVEKTNAIQSCLVNAEQQQRSATSGRDARMRSS